MHNLFLEEGARDAEILVEFNKSGFTNVAGAPISSNCLVYLRGKYPKLFTQRHARRAPQIESRPASVSLPRVEQPKAHDRCFDRLALIEVLMNHSGFSRDQKFDMIKMAVQS